MRQKQRERASERNCNMKEGKKNTEEMDHFQRVDENVC